MLHYSLKLSTFRIRTKVFEQFFKTEGYFTYCKNIDDLKDDMTMRHFPVQFRLLIHASKASLKANFAHNTYSMYLPLAKKETYSALMKNVLVGSFFSAI